MPSNLVPRLNKLELIAGPKKEYPKVVRLVVNEGEEQDAYRQAAEMGLDTSPESKDVLIIRLIAASPQRRANTDPTMAARKQSEKIDVCQKVEHEKEQDGSRERSTSVRRRWLLTSSDPGSPPSNICLR
jgi:hypothetical protein